MNIIKIRYLIEPRDMDMDLDRDIEKDMDFYLFQKIVAKT